jgi:hypothetical protein
MGAPIFITEGGQTVWEGESFIAGDPGIRFSIYFSPERYNPLNEPWLRRKIVD